MIDVENQTQFAQDEPLMEAPVVMHDDTQIDPAVAKRKSRNKKLMMAVVGIFVLLFVSLLLIALTMPPQYEQTAGQPTPTPLSQQQQEQSELDAMLDLLHEDITKADPSTSDLPIPPIDFTLTLEERN